MPPSSRRARRPATPAPATPEALAVAAREAPRTRHLVPLRQHTGPPVVVRIEAIELLVRLERDGFGLDIHAGGLTIRPASRLADEDRAALRRYREDAVLVLSLDAQEAGSDNA